MSATVMWGLALTATGLAGTLAAELARQRWGVFVAKPVASAGFLVVALGSGALDGTYGIWVLAALVLSFVGDLFLMSRGRAQFQLGLVSFLLAHVAYVGAFLVAGISATWALAAAGGALAVAWVVMRWLWPHVEPDMRGPVVAYVVVISTMLSLAVGTLGAGRSLLIAVGAGLFYVSDLFVARDRFVTPSFLNTLIGLPLYYLAQVLIALSVAA